MNLVSVLVLTVIILVCILFGYILGYAANSSSKEKVDTNGRN